MSVAKFADPHAVEDEMRAQIERALSDGIRPSHLDAHMGTAYLKPFLPVLFRVADAYGIPPALCQNLGSLLSEFEVPDDSKGLPNEFIEEAKARGWPLLDNFLMEFCPEGDDAETHFVNLVKGAPPGTHYLALHANAEDDMRVFAPDKFSARFKEYNFFRNPKTAALFKKFCKVTSWRNLIEQRVS